MRRVSRHIILALGVGLLSGIAAADPPLKGKYGSTSSSACISTTSTIGTDLEFNCSTTTANCWQSTFSGYAVRTFNGDGTGSVQGTDVSTIIPVPFFLQPHGSSDTFSYDFTYTVAEDGSIDAKVTPGTWKGTILTGPSAGDTYTVDTFSYTGWITKDRQVLTFSTPTSSPLEIETNQYYKPNATTPYDTEYRICHRSTVLIKIGN